jgi:hypothetical protein
MQRRDVLPNRPIEPFQELDRDARQWNQFRDAEDDALGHRNKAMPLTSSATRPTHEHQQHLLFLRQNLR